MNEIFGFALVMTGVLVALGIAGLLVWSLIWVNHDAEARGKPGWAVSLFVLFLKWPISLLLWIAFRPEPVGKFAKTAPRI